MPLDTMQNLLNDFWGRGVREEKRCETDRKLYRRVWLHGIHASVVMIGHCPSVPTFQLFGEGDCLYHPQSRCGLVSGFTGTFQAAPANKVLDLGSGGK